MTEYRLMRGFEDHEGRFWQAALLDASYGSVLLVFSPLGGGEIRKLVMQVENMAEALDRLAELDED
jgi:hypothetical protein